MTRKDGKLDFSKKDGKRICKNHMEEMMNKENDWDHMIESSMVEGRIEKITHKEMAIAIKSMIPGKTDGPSEVWAEMISASGEVGIGVMMELYKHMLDGKEMPGEWQTNVLVSIFKGKKDVRNCKTYRGVKLLEHAMKVVERVLERRIRELINIEAMQFGFMPGKRTTDELLAVRRMKVEYIGLKTKSCICVV